MPLLLGAVMLAVVIAAALTPNVGIVQAQTPSQYGQPSSTPCSGISASSCIPSWVVAAIGLLVVLAALGLVLIFVRRRRRPPTGGAVPAWQGGSPPSTPPRGPSAPPPSAAPSGPPAAAPAYLETPEDVGQAPPYVAPPASTAAAVGGAGAVAGAAAAEKEPDIDSLMAELDKISGEILKRAPKTGSQSGSGSPPPSEKSR